MPIATIPVKWLKPQSNNYTSRFEIPPPATTVGTSSYHEIEEMKRRTQRDSAKKTSKFALNAITSQVEWDLELS
jgi:hypothetical protein